MKIYDTLIIGSGYFSAGYASFLQDTIICEEHQICDTSFYLPLKSFAYKPYFPKTEEGTRLFDIYQSLALFKDGEQNTNGFEFAFCKYITENGINILLKCRVIRVKEQENGIFDVTIQTNEGLNHLFAKKIINATNEPKKKYFTVLFICNNIEKEKDKLLSLFSGAQIEPAFYKGRYAIHIPAYDTDENLIKLEVYKKWKTLSTNAQILYMAPVFYGEANADKRFDGNYNNPIEAFESGYLYAKETNK